MDLEYVVIDTGEHNPYYEEEQRRTIYGPLKQFRTPLATASNRISHALAVCKLSTTARADLELARDIIKNADRAIFNAMDKENAWF